MELISGLFNALLDVWKEMYGEAKEILPRFLKLALWILCGIVIIPCVYISAIFMPMWTEWGESL